MREEGSPGSLAAASRWRGGASPAGHCAKRLVPAPGKKGNGSFCASGTPPLNGWGGDVVRIKTLLPAGAWGSARPGERKPRLCQKGANSEAQLSASARGSSWPSGRA